MFSISRGEHFRCEVGWSKRLYFLLHTSLHSFEHRSSTGKDYVFEKVLPDVSLALNDSVVGVLMNAIRRLSILHLVGPRREEDLWAFQAILVYRDGLRAW